MHLPLDPLLRQLKTGGLHPRSLIHRLSDRIEAVDGTIRAFLPEPGRRERLLGELALLEEQYPDPALRPPLFGLPVGVKDLFRVEGFATRAGSRLPATLFDGPQARAVGRLKKAGALVLGKTVTTEFAWFQPGPTRNPYNTEHTPGGSSSGSAAAVAAGMCPLSLGTQTIGSIGRPAAYCGVAGFKPTQGRMSCEGVIPFSPHVDQPGFFTASLSGVEMVSSILLEDWQGVPADLPAPRVGVPAGTYLLQAGEEMRQLFHLQVRGLERAGMEVVEIDLFGDIEPINRAHRRIVAHDFSRVHASWYAQHAPLYGEHSVAMVEEGRQVGPAELAAALDLRKEWIQRVEDVSREEGIDLWISPPAQGTAPRGLGSTGSPLMNLPWTFTGMPSLVLPAGSARNGLPIGLQAVALRGADEVLLHWAALLSERVLRIT